MIDIHVVLTEERLRRSTGMSFEDVKELGNLVLFAYKLNECGILSSEHNYLVSLVEDSRVVCSFEAYWWDRHAAGCDDGWGVDELEVSHD